MCVWVCLYGFRPVYFCATFNLSFPLTHNIDNTYVRLVCVCRKCASHFACAIIMCSCVLCASLWWCWKETTQMTQVACFLVSSTLFLYYSLTHSLAQYSKNIYSDQHLHIVLGVFFFFFSRSDDTARRFLRWQSIFSSSIGWCSLICATQNEYVIFKYSCWLDKNNPQKSKESAAALFFSFFQNIFYRLIFSYHHHFSSWHNLLSTAAIKL